MSDSRQVGETVQVRATLQMVGKLNSAMTEAKDVPISAAGQVNFQETVLNRDNREIKTLRNYLSAEAELHAGGHTEKNHLSDSVRSIVAQCSDQRVELASSKGYLTRTELETITFPGDYLVVYRLLPKKGVQQGEQWQHTSEDLAVLLNLEHVGVNEVKSRLMKIENGLAVIQTTGVLKGRAAGVATEMRLTGECRYDLRWKRINWLHLRISETRDESSEAPGYAADAEIKMLIQPVQPGDAAEPTTANLTITDRARLLSYSSESAGFRCLHPRRWHTLNEGARHSTWRVADGDDVIAQCNVIRLKDLPAGKQLGLEEFQADVQKALGEQFVEFEGAGRKQRKDGYDVIRVSAAGIVSKIPVRWIYYHVTSPDGKRANVVFVLDRDNLEKLASDDVIAASSLSLTIASDALPKATDASSEAEASPPAVGGETARRRNEPGSTTTR